MSEPDWSLWTTRTSSSGVFAEAKASGDVLYGAQRADALGLSDDWWRTWGHCLLFDVPAVAAVLYLGWRVAS
jgi:hypothetical protein